MAEISGSAPITAQLQPLLRHSQRLETKTRHNYRLLNDPTLKTKSSASEQPTNANLVITNDIDYTLTVPENDTDPATLHEAKTRHDWPEWDKAINQELNNLKEKRTWTLVDLPKDRKAIGCK